MEVLSTQLSPGVYARILVDKEETQWSWKISSHKTVIANGVESSQEAAAEKLKRATGEYLITRGIKSQPRREARRLLREMVTKRPYLISGLVCMVHEMAATFDRVMREIEKFELQFYEQCPAYIRTPLPTHHRSLSPQEAARRSIQAFTCLGLITSGENGQLLSNGLLKWAQEYFAYGSKHLTETEFDNCIAAAKANRSGTAGTDGAGG